MGRRLCATAWLDEVRAQVTDIGAKSDPRRGNNKGKDPDLKHLRDKRQTGTRGRGQGRAGDRDKRGQ